VIIELGRWSIARRPALVGLAFLTALVGGFAVVRAAQNVWAVDALRNLAAAVALQHGTFGSVPDYLYSPLAAALTVPALALSPDVAVVAWLALKIVLLAVGTAVATRGLGGIERLLLGVAVVGFLPILYDLELGNVTVIVLIALVAIAWTPDRVVTGIPLGLILATAPKPQLIPVLIWLALAHRRALVGVLVTAALATLVGLALAGPAAYAAWVEALRAPAYLNSGDVINLALWSLPPVVAVPAAIAAAGGLFIALRRGYWPGLLAACCVGLLLAPYTLVYGAGLLLVVAPAAVRASPRAVLGLALSAPVALVLVFQGWVALALAVALLAPANAWPSRPLAGPSDARR
jgi:Glycosyltransferase family 87